MTFSPAAVAYFAANL